MVDAKLRLIVGEQKKRDERVSRKVNNEDLAMVLRQNSGHSFAIWVQQ
jgi:hypothetical protein